MKRRLSICFTVFILAFTVSVDADESTAPQDGNKWHPLFDGKTLSGWSRTEFGGEGNVGVKDGRLILDFGSPMTGVTYDPKTSTLPALPVSNYEIRLEAQRIDGNDFFCGLTFPVGPSHCSLIVGGWGGALVGLSSLDGHDASENETQQIMAFKDAQWYAIRLRVADDRIVVWIDEKPVIDQSIVDRVISIRPEVLASRPLGFSTFETRAALRGIAIRKLEKSRTLE